MMGRMRLRREPVERVPLAVGNRVRFKNENFRVWWTVRAVSPDGRWAILTKPFNPQRTVLYTVVDFDSGVRGPDNYGSLGYETPEQIAAAMERFVAGNAEVSVRYDVYLNIDEVRPGSRTGKRNENLMDKCIVCGSDAVDSDLCGECLTDVNWRTDGTGR